MSRHGYEVPWHRVVLSTGHGNPAGPVRALELLKVDGTPLLPDGGERVDLAAARWDGPVDIRPEIRSSADAIRNSVGPLVVDSWFVPPDVPPRS